MARPLQMTSHDMANQLATDIFMRRERRRLQARHIWEKIEPHRPMIEERVWTKQATGLPNQALCRRLFLQEYTEEFRWLENSYKGSTLTLDPKPLKASRKTICRHSPTARSKESNAIFFVFLAGCCMAQRLRCPGGRPSVSYNWVKVSQKHWI